MQVLFEFDFFFRSVVSKSEKSNSPFPGHWQMASLHVAGRLCGGSFGAMLGPLWPSLFPWTLAASGCRGIIGGIGPTLVHHERYGKTYPP